MVTRQKDASTNEFIRRSNKNLHLTRIVCLQTRSDLKLKTTTYPLSRDILSPIREFVWRANPPRKQITQYVDLL